MKTIIKYHIQVKNAYDVFFKFNPTKAEVQNDHHCR